MNILFSLLCLPFYLAFTVYKRSRPLIGEDFKAWVVRHKCEKMSTYKAFVILMKKKEWRSVFYFRLPFTIRHVLNILLKRSDLRIHTLQVGGGIIVEHGWGSIIVAKRFGKNLTQNCTIGWNHGSTPEIGDNVKLFPGSVVAGPVIIGNNVAIGANCVVLQDIPDDSICYGNPCVIIRR